MVEESSFPLLVLSLFHCPVNGNTHLSIQAFTLICRCLNFDYVRLSICYYLGSRFSLLLVPNQWYNVYVVLFLGSFPSCVNSFCSVQCDCLLLVVNKCWSYLLSDVFNPESDLNMYVDVGRMATVY
ncbi:hypothetical protein R3W88_015064 [Solanum pinnatisectum]|uniref:Uncharacterized protein n=1 Tax=Solanum pinnatisectum TaxID=50273 RepID=A0AAV9KTC8_9SOLN|nr:hypothetical protein R3W88_015064 [Solanum pinnatisectum]